MQDPAPCKIVQRPGHGTRAGRSPHRTAGGVFSPRSGRRSPIRVLPGGQAAYVRYSISTGHRRLTSRQVPDCLRCPAEERTHPRPHHPEPPPAHPRQHPPEPGTLRGGPAGGAFHLETPARTANATGGRVGKRNRAKRSAALQHDHPTPTGHRAPGALSRSSIQLSHHLPRARRRP